MDMCKKKGEFVEKWITIKYEYVLNTAIKVNCRVTMRMKVSLYIQSCIQKKRREKMRRRMKKDFRTIKSIKIKQIKQRKLRNMQMEKKNSNIMQIQRAKQEEWVQQGDTTL